MSEFFQCKSEKDCYVGLTKNATDVVQSLLLIKGKIGERVWKHLDDEFHEKITASVYINGGSHIFSHLTLKNNEGEHDCFGWTYKEYVEGGFDWISGEQCWFGKTNIM